MQPNKQREDNDMDTLTDEQREWIDGLRALADFTEKHPDAINIYSVFDVIVFADDAPHMAELARSIGGPLEKVSTGSWYNLRRHFGPHRLDITATHESVCEKVQTGTETKEVPDPEALAAVPKITVEEPVYEWVCPDSILAAAS